MKMRNDHDLGIIVRVSRCRTLRNRFRLARYLKIDAIRRISFQSLLKLNLVSLPG